MKKLGISIYPGVGDRDEILSYINLARSYGFKRIFTCLISVEEDSLREYIGNFKDIVKYANNLGMEVIADLEPSVFKRLGVSFRDLSLFEEIGLYGIRLDMGFSGVEEAMMSCNPYGIKIELNMSGGNRYLENILSYKPNVDNIIGCHNFYPHIYTGLGINHFIKCSREFKDLGIRTAAFINSQNGATGPWPLSEGLCTLEMHRNLPIDVQAKHLFATEVIDDVIIANAYASEEEIWRLSMINRNRLEFKIELADNLPELERKIIFEEFHFVRGDVSDYMLRSTQSRIKYKDYEFKAFNTPDIKRGDILIDSSLYPRYAGELQIALKNMKNTGKTNVVGKIAQEELFLLDLLGPWSKFGFVEKI